MIVRSVALIAACVLAATPALAQEPTAAEHAATGAASATAPETTAPETTAPETEAPETEAPETEAPETVALPVRTPIAAAGDAGYFQIGPEDVLDIQVWKNDDLSRVVPVRPDGRISLPLVNDIMAAGLTPTELRAQITERLEPFVPSAEVSVIVREVHSFKVSIVGAVRMPGTYEVKSAATVLDIIARAQGLNEFARRGEIVVHRTTGGTTTQMDFHYDRVAEGRNENLVVQRGDIIVVP